MSNKKLLVIGGSNNPQSINRTFASYAASLVQDAEATVLDLRNYSLPLYAPDLENATGIPDAAKKFAAQIEACDGIVLSLAEYNGSYTPAFKNLFDWATRHQQKIWVGKPMLLLSTSPGGRGGQGVRQSALSSFPHLGGNIVADMGLPSYYDNFKQGEGITNSELAAELNAAVGKLVAAL